eukprot:4506491-Pleurochrysis_carterae.AAC.14
MRAHFHSAACSVFGTSTEDVASDVGLIERMHSASKAQGWRMETVSIRALEKLRNVETSGSDSACRAETSCSQASARAEEGARRE